MLDVSVVRIERLWYGFRVCLASSIARVPDDVVLSPQSYVRVFVAESPLKHSRLAVETSCFIYVRKRRAATAADCVPAVSHSEMFRERRCGCTFVAFSPEAERHSGFDQSQY